MNRIYFGILCIISFSSLANSPQDSMKLSGIVFDEFNKTIPYVNIGIEDKNLGTISDLNGSFELIIPSSLLVDSIKFSHVSYHSHKLALIHILSKKEIAVKLVEKSFELNEIVISNKEPKQKKLGTKGRSRLLSMPVYMDRDIYEIAFSVKAQKSIATIKSLSIFIAYAKIDSGIFRVNLYENIENHPATKINSENVVIQSPIKRASWNVIDLSSFNLSFDKDVFVSLELIPFSKDGKSYQISYGAKLLASGKTFIRRSSQGKWNGTPGNASIYIDVSY